MEGYQLDGNSKIKLIGDSTASGRGSSDCMFDGEYIIKFEGRKFYRQTGQKCWGSILKKYIEEKYPGAKFYNNGINGITSHHLHKYVNNLVHLEDTMVLIMLGANNRSIPGGIELLRNNMTRVIKQIKMREIPVVLLSPAPSTYANEYRGDRRYHLDQVNELLREVADKQKIPFISIYDYLMQYVREHQMTVEELMQPELNGTEALEHAIRFSSLTEFNRYPDGLHPPDGVHQLIADHIIDRMEW